MLGSVLLSTLAFDRWLGHPSLRLVTSEAVLIIILIILRMRRFMHFHFRWTQLLRVIAKESICWIGAWLQVFHAKLIS